MANAAVLTFDDITSGNETSIADGYGEFDWSNFYVLNSDNYSYQSGYINGTVSTSYVAYNAYANDASITSDEIFTFNGAYFTGAWRNGLEITITGSLSGEELYSETIVVDTDEATWFCFDWVGIDTLSFSTSGGTSAGFSHASNYQLVMDNFTYNEPISTVPVPATIVLLGSGLLGMLGCLRCRKA